MNEPRPDVYTVEEAAVLLRIGRSAAYAAVRRGELPSVRLGRSIRVPRHSLEALLRASPLEATDGADAAEIDDPPIPEGSRRGP